MSIVAANVKLYKSQEMNDNDNGGGVMTGSEVADGVSGDLFPSISRLDKSQGKLNLRKIFGKIDSDNSDLYGGAHAVLTSLSTDAEVSELIVKSSAFEHSDVVAELTENHNQGTLRSYLSVAAVAGDTTIEFTSAIPLVAGGTYLFYTTKEFFNVVSVSGTTATLLGPLHYNHSVASTYNYIYPAKFPTTGRCYGVSQLFSAASSGQKEVVVVNPFARLLPNNFAAVPEFDPAADPYAQEIFGAGDTVLLKEGATEEECTISSISGKTLTLVSDLVNTFTSAAICCSICPLGDLQAAKGTDFTQETWDGSTFSDSQDGAAASGTYNFATYPLSVNNHDAIADRIGLDFTSATAFNIISELYGNLGTGTTSADVAPVNPLTSDPYFTLDKDGFGGTWQAGNVLRFNVIGALAEVWLARCINTGASGTGADGTDIELRGDVAS